jgi:hypothetical protein
MYLGQDEWSFGSACQTMQIITESAVLPRSADLSRLRISKIQSFRHRELCRLPFFRPSCGLVLHFFDVLDARMFSAFFFLWHLYRLFKVPSGSLDTHRPQMLTDATDEKLLTELPRIQRWNLSDVLTIYICSSRVLLKVTNSRLFHWLIVKFINSFIFIS